MDIIAKAENAIKGIMVKDKFNNNVLLLKTGHIRKFLTSVNLVRDRIEVYKMRSAEPDTLPPDLVAEVKFLKIKLLYLAGREKNIVGPFVEKSGLIEMIDNIGDSTARFTEFAKYVQALGAFHKFYGGKDK
ncbi:MAG: type III-A CRISPR-associated protein Csm2 [Phascolarctobacterium sp.]|nr:MAG: type III-A CRISPR-associated protein Csm2 [Phascolarctobacterium sp.]